MVLSSRLLPLAVALLSTTVVATFASEDVVHHYHPRSERLVRSSGQILDYSARQLRLRTKSGRETGIASEQIERIDSQWTPQHAAADRLQDEGRYNEALEQYGVALRQEERPWVRYRIVSQMIWCYRSLGQWERAGEMFAQLMQYQPDTPYFDAIPLVWRTSPPSPSLEQRAKSWLGTNHGGAIRLMGASFLLSGRESLLSRQVLLNLQTDTSPNVALMAQAQMWRLQVASTSVDDLAQWQSTIQKMPRSLRAGPYFVLGKALDQQNRLDAAALSLLRVPILYPRHRALAAESLVSAGGLLERLARPREAENVYREVTDRYPESISADLARQQLDRLSTDGSR